MFVPESLLSLPDNCGDFLQMGILFFFVLFKFHILTIALSIYLKNFSPDWRGYSILNFT